MVWVGGSVCGGKGERAGGGEEGRRRKRGSFDFDTLGWAQEWEGRAQEKLLREHSGDKQGNTEERGGRKRWDGLCRGASKGRIQWRNGLGRGLQTGSW